jgi:head-tail adaptor
VPAKFGAGQLIELVAFDKRSAVDDGYGNTVTGDWQEQFRKRAKFIFLRGSETVMAGRLESQESIVAQVWANDQTRQIRPDWQMRNVRNGESFNVRSIEEDKSRAVLDLLCESNVATG